jgi:uncharacterized protein (TIGR02117 family)
MRAILLRFVAALLIVAALYAGAALIGGVIPANSGWRQAERGARIYVVDNGIHTDLALPADALAGLIRATDLRVPGYANASHVLIGWGDRDFYLNTPSWWEMNPLRAASALIGTGKTVLHVSHIPEPNPGQKVRALTLRPEEYTQLVAYVRASFAEGPAVPGYGVHDAFYPARGGYSAIRTCNQWTANALKAAGVKMGVWTPFPFGVMQWL